MQVRFTIVPKECVFSMKLHVSQWQRTPPITTVLNQHDTILWLKVDKDFFHLDADIYLAGIYIWPEN